VAVFNDLGHDEMIRIIRLMLEEVRAESAANGIELVWDEAVEEAVYKTGYQRGLGARPFRREIQRKVEDRLSEMFLAGEVASGDTARVSVAEGGGIEVRKDTVVETLRINS